MTTLTQPQRMFAALRAAVEGINVDPPFRWAGEFLALESLPQTVRNRAFALELESIAAPGNTTPVHIYSQGGTIGAQRPMQLSLSVRVSYDPTQRHATTQAAILGDAQEIIKALCYRPANWRGGSPATTGDLQATGIYGIFHTGSNLARVVPDSYWILSVGLQIYYAQVGEV